MLTAACFIVQLMFQCVVQCTVKCITTFAVWCFVLCTVKPVLQFSLKWTSDCTTEGSLYSKSKLIFDYQVFSYSFLTQSWSGNINWALNWPIYSCIFAHGQICKFSKGGFPSSDSVNLTVLVYHKANSNWRLSASQLLPLPPTCLQHWTLFGEFIGKTSFTASALGESESRSALLNFSSWLWSIQGQFNSESCGSKNTVKLIVYACSSHDSLSLIVSDIMTKD